MPGGSSTAPAALEISEFGADVAAFDDPHKQPTTW
jgi:hypothetical protein